MTAIARKMTHRMTVTAPPRQTSPGQIEHGEGVARGGGGEFGGVFVALRCEGGETLRLIGRAVALAAVARDREVGRVGLDHDGVERQLARENAQLRRTQERVQAAEP